jgi:hypothetical protein
MREVLQIGFVAIDVRILCTFAKRSLVSPPTLSPAVPHGPYGCLCPAWSKAAAIPAPAIKARPRRAVILRSVHPVIVSGALAFDHFGRTVAWQKAVAVPVARHTAFTRVLVLLHGRGQSDGPEREHNRDSDHAQANPSHCTPTY